MRTLLLVGATGLVGQAVLRQALAGSGFSRIVAPTRRPLAPAGESLSEDGAVPSSRLENPLVNFERLPADAPWWSADAAICTLGTTIRKAGSQEAFRRVDHDYVVAVARLARGHGTRAFALTSALGAHPESRFFYNRIKGETEVGVAACAFPSFTIVRPGLIGGRRGESRPAELAAMNVLRLLGPILPRRYRINPAENIARALLNAAARAEPGHHLVGSEDLV